MEFRVSPDNATIQKHDNHIRLFLWGAVLLLVAITITGIVGVRSIGRSGETVLVVIAGAVVVSVVGAAYVLGAQEGIEISKRNTVIVMTETDLVRQRSGWPEVRIALSEVKNLYERPGWLLVESVEPRRRIAISRDVDRFQFLRSELLKRASLVKLPRRSPLLALPTLVSLFCWALVFWSKESQVVKTAACMALALFAWGSFHLGRLRIPSPKRYLVWAMLATIWMAALWIIYSRLARL